MTTDTITRPIPPEVAAVLTGAILGRPPTLAEAVDIAAILAEETGHRMRVEVCPCAKTRALHFQIRHVDAKDVIR